MWNRSLTGWNQSSEGDGGGGVFLRPVLRLLPPEFTCLICTSPIRPTLWLRPPPFSKTPSDTIHLPRRLSHRPVSPCRPVPCQVDLLRFFNSRCCQLVVGAGAIQLVGLKTITSRNLSLAARAVQLVLHFIPVIRTHFQVSNTALRADALTGQ